MRSILAIDPGCTDSAYVFLTEGLPVRFGKLPNLHLLNALSEFRHVERLYVEMVASYGMPVGREVFETCVWIGRFQERWGKESNLVYRKVVKMHLCGRNNAKDANIRQSVIDRFGPGKDKAIGKKHSPGPLYGVKADVWQALALALTCWDIQQALP